VSCDSQAEELLLFMKGLNRLLVITGAGCSTGSGISDYRDDKGSWKIAAPIEHQDFLKSVKARKRYWFRSQLGFPSFRDAQPNQAHLVLARLEEQGVVDALITQNVDRLHQKAGQEKVVDLHGRLDRVRCLDCGQISSRAEIQDWLELNNDLTGIQTFELRPDGDASIDDPDLSSFQEPNCAKCAGTLQPDVVFFGGSVPEAISQETRDLVDSSDGVLVIGTSLMAFSSYRLVRRAHQKKLPIASLNLGVTRADDLLDQKFVGDCEEVLEALGRKFL
jgi:NAD-dependent SIR2 family protein deacetylase